MIAHDFLLQANSLQSIHLSSYHAYIGGIIRNQKGILLEIGGMANHVHIVVRFRADSSISDLVRIIKANSSKWPKERHGRPVGFAWQSGYGAFTLSESQLASVRGYVNNQCEHHRARTFQEEFLAFLQQHREM